jgi:peptidoglycan-associated lipoprotein
MKRATGLLLLVLGFVLAAQFSFTPAFADVDPAYAPTEEAATSDPQPAAQFPQVESTPIAPQPMMGPDSVIPPSGPISVSNQSTAVQSGAAIQGDFPKVQTKEDELLARKFQWWPTDAQPAPVKDTDRSGYWWWPDQPGATASGNSLWGNQGYIYVRKIIFDYKSETVQTPQGPMKPSLVIKRIIKNVRVFFDYDKSDLRDDAIDILSKAVYTLQHNDKADILVTGNADLRGSEQYNEKLGAKRADAVKGWLIDQGIAEERVRILSRGKLDALAPKGDLVGMQKDRNAQFMIAEVEEVMIPADKADLFEDKQIEEKQELEGQVRVSTKEYTIQSGDTLWAIAQREYGDGRQWKRIYEFNQDVISNPNKPKKGTRIQLPIE